MPTTNSTDHYLNWYKTGGDDNSSINEWIYTNTGNQSRKKGLPVLNETFTLSSSKSDPVINAKVLNWNDVIKLKGNEIRVTSSDSDVDLGGSPIDTEAWYDVYGHPDKFVYDYQQKWNNCGVVSSLNVLSMAGVKDIVELTSAYSSYLSNPTTTTQTVIEWDEESASWVMEEKTITTYPSVKAESEDAFLLWAVQNSFNDQKWYDDRFSSGYINTFTDTQKRAEVKDFCFHTLNAEDYLTVEDLYKIKYTEVGTTTYKHADNILEYWGVPAEVHYYTSVPYDADTLEDYNIDKTFDGIDILVKLQSDPGDQEVYISLEDAIDKFNAPNQVVDIEQNTDKYEYKAEQTINYNQYLTVKETTTTVTQEPIKELTPGSGTVVLPGVDKEEETTTYEVVEKEYATNLEKYSFLEQFDAYVKEGKGVILEGYANAFIGGNGGGHAITLTGVVWGEVTTKITEYYINDELKRTEGESARDIIGVYVLDTGGFLGNVEGSQFISCDMLYKFLTDTRYSDSFGLEETPWISGGTAESFVNVTKENIRNWAENLNLTGNNRKNVLEGNEGRNIIKAGAGDDVLRGMGGDDSIQGDSGDDVITGGEGNDILTGGSGNDIYMFEAAEVEMIDGKIVCTAINSGNDLINANSGKDSLQFINTIVVSKEEYNKLALALDAFKDFGTPVPEITASEIKESYKHTDIANMYYQNRDGHLVIKYNTDVTKDGETTTQENTITINNYFKKNLYSSVKDIQTQTRIFVETSMTYLAYPDKIYDFVTEFIQRGHIDYYTEQDKNNKISGTKFKDYIVGGNKNDSITAGANEDILSGGACNDTIKGGAGDDTIYASAGNDSISGEAGKNIIKYKDTFVSFNGTDTITTYYGGNDTIVSGSGSDYIELLDCKKADLKYAKSGNNLVITYDETTGASITINSYFSKKGKTSVKTIALDPTATNLADRVVDLVYDYNEINALANKGIVDNRSKSTVNENIGLETNYGYDKLTGGKGNDSIVGGLGNDTLYGGNGNDTLVGGLGADKMYGQAGDNTYVFTGKAQGSDTIYTTSNGTTTLNFAGTGLTFNKIGSTDCIDEYSYTKSKNDLVINYATNIQEDDNATVTISGFFTSKNNFILNDGTNSLNLKEDIAIYMTGNEEKKTKITGSVYNDSIVAYEFNDTLTGGKGNDTLYGGKGNDAITGGAGNNIIDYKKGDGYDTITLTKNENLVINLEGYTTTDKLDFNIVKGNLIVSTVDTETGLKTDILNLKSFGTKDVTTANGSVLLNFNGAQIDLRKDAYLGVYSDFTAKKYSYTGNWHSEYIFADTLNYTPVTKDRGAKINAGAGDDFIVGSFYNDTINGGDGNDTIYGDFGKNTIDGGKGSDKYHLFYADSNADREDSDIEISPESQANSKEITTIKDTGKVAEDVDTVIIYDKYTDLQFDSSFIQDENDGASGYLWFNTDKKGNKTFYVMDKNGNSATMTGVEQIIANGGTDADTTDDYIYNHNSAALIQAIDSWMESKGLSDVKAVMDGKAGEVNKALLLEVFNSGWEQYQP